MHVRIYILVYVYIYIYIHTHTFITIAYDFGPQVPNSWLASDRAQEVNAAQTIQEPPMATISAISGPSTQSEKQVTIGELLLRWLWS